MGGIFLLITCCGKRVIGLYHCEILLKLVTCHLILETGMPVILSSSSLDFLVHVLNGDWGFSGTVAGRSWQNCLLLVSHIFLTNVLFYTYLKGAIIHAHDKRKFAMIRKSIEWNLSLFTTLDPHPTLQKQSRLMAFVYRLPENFYTWKNMLLLCIKPSQASWWKENNFAVLSNSVIWKFRKGTAGMTSLCSMIPGPSA